MTDIFENFMGTKLTWEWISLGASINSRMKRLLLNKTKINSADSDFV